MRSSGDGLACLTWIYNLRMNADSQHPGLDDEQAYLAAEVFQLLADPTRIRLLWALVGREMPVNELALRVGKPGPAVSQHLAKLRLGRLVLTRRAGTSVYYRIANEHIEQLVTDAVYNAEHATSDHPAHHRAAEDAGDVLALSRRLERGAP